MQIEILIRVLNNFVFTINTLMDTIKGKIKFLIAEIFGTQRRLADAVGISTSSMTEYIKNDRSPNGDVLKKFVDAGISANWLLSGEGDIFTTNDAGLALAELYQAKREAEETRIKAAEMFRERFNKPLPKAAATNPFQKENKENDTLENASE